MPEKVIIRSATVDRHGDYTPLEMLEDYINAVNSGDKMRYLVNHRRDLPPVDYFDNAELREENGIYHACVEPITFSTRKAVPWDSDLFIEKSGSHLTLSSRNDDAPDKLRIAVDKNNFKDEPTLGRAGKDLHELHQGKIHLKLNMRKNLLPDPQVVITLMEYGAFYALVKPLLEKMGEKIAESIGEDIYKGSKAGLKKMIFRLIETVRISRGEMIPQNKTLLTIIEIPGTPYIELHIRSDDPTKIEKGLKPSKLLQVHTRINELQRYLDITEICFVLNAKDKWEFRYLITASGQIVGTKIAYKKRDQLMTRISLSPTKAFSIGATEVSFERRSTAELNQASIEIPGNNTNN